MRKINLIIVHCTATVEGRDYTVSTIDQWHRQRGFAAKACPSFDATTEYKAISDM